MAAKTSKRVCILHGGGALPQAVEQHALFAARSAEGEIDHAKFAQWVLVEFCLEFSRIPAGGLPDSPADLLRLSGSLPGWEFALWDPASGSWAAARGGEALPGHPGATRLSDGRLSGDVSEVFTGEPGRFRLWPLDY